MSGWVAGEHLLCPVRSFIDVVGGKWKISIYAFSPTAPPTATATLRNVWGCNKYQLSKSLQELDKDGILNRKQYLEIPPRVEYSLTEKGLSLIPVIVCMRKWSLESCGEEKDKVYCKACKSK